MLDATTAAHSLITLASPTKPSKDAGLMTPPRKDTIQNMEYESPDHTRHVSIKCKGTKRPRENLVLVLYDFSDDSDHAPLPRGSKKPNGKASQAQFSQEKLASVIDATERMGLTRGKGDEYAVCFSVRGPMLESPRASAHWPGHAAPSLPVSVQDVQ